MAALTAVVVALSVAVAANFLFLLAVVRRLRLQRPAPSVIDLPRLGMRAPAFAAQDVDGRTVDDDFYTQGDVVVAFLSDDCQPCQQVKAELVRDPLDTPLLAFVYTTAGGTAQAEFAAELGRAGARAVLLEPGSEFHMQFSVSAFPTLLRLRNGVVVAASIKLAEMREQVGTPIETLRQQLVREETGRHANADHLVRQ